VIHPIPGTVRRKMRSLSSEQQELFRHIQISAAEGQEYFQAVLKKIQGFVGGEEADVEESIQLDLRFVRENARQLSELVRTFLASFP